MVVIAVGYEGRVPRRARFARAYRIVDVVEVWYEGSTSRVPSTEWYALARDAHQRQGHNRQAPTSGSAP